MKTWDVVVIGSGISALTSGLLLAKKGLSVCLLEQHYKPGGYLHAFKRFGYEYDTGAHYVGAMDKGEPFQALLEYLGIYDESFFQPLDADGIDVMSFPTFSFQIPNRYETLKAALIEKFPQEKDGIESFLNLVQQAARSFPSYQYNDNYDMTSMASYIETPLSEVGSRLTQNPQLLALLFSYCGLHGVLPQDMSFGFHALIFDSLLRGAYSFRKSGDVLAQAYVKKLEDFGAQVHLRSTVQKIRVKDNLVTGLELSSGELIQAKKYIAGIHPQSLFEMVEGGRMSPAFQNRLKKASESIGVFGVYGVTEKLNLSPHRNYYFFDIEQIENLLEKRHPQQKPTLSFLTFPHQNTASESQQPFSLHSPCQFAWFEQWQQTSPRRRPEAYDQLKDTIQKQTFSLLEEHGLSLKDKTQRSTSSTPLTNQFYNPSPEGSAYGIYHSMSYTGARALGPRTKFNNLLLTGQNTLVPGLLGSAISGLRTAGHIMGIKPTLKELKAYLNT